MRVNPSLCATILVSLLFGCSGKPNDSSVPDGRERISITRWMLPAPGRAVVVLLVDDTQDPGGTRLRENLASAAQLQDQPIPPMTGACPGTLGDPLVYHPIDVRFAVVRPSAIPSERLTTPNEVSALARKGEINDPLAYSQWQSAIQAVIRTTPTNKGSFALIESAEDALQLLTGQRSARTEQEQLQLASLLLSPDTLPEEKADHLIVNIATAHDDDSAAAVSDYADLSQWVLNETTDAPFIDMALLAADSAGNAYATKAEFTTAYPRLAAWVSPAMDKLHVLPIEFGSLFMYRMLDSHAKPPCMSAPPKTLIDGSAACRIHLWRPSNESCDLEQGQLDPLVDGFTRKPRVVSEYGSTFRVCELRQFQDANLRACLDDVALPDPEAGWCFPEASPECSNFCPRARPVGQNFRYVGGINNPPSGGVLEIACAL